MLKDKEIDALLEHYKEYLGDVKTLEFMSTKNMTFKPQLVIAKPKKYNPYYVVATVGLSQVKLKGAYSHCELIMLLDENWKFKMDNINSNWPFELMCKISNMIYLTGNPIGYGQYFINDNNKTFSPLTDMGVALVGIPAMFDKKFFELKNGKKLTNFFILTTATFDELKLIKHLGGINFIQRYLLPEGEDAFVVRNNKL